MRMLLTAAGTSNPCLTRALTELVERPFAEARVAIVITASVAESGGWVLGALERIRRLGWREIDMIELNGLPYALVAERLRAADVVWATGGNQFHLAHSIVRNDLVGLFRELLDTKVYVGVSAGSMIFSRHFDEHAAELLGDLPDLQRLDASTIAPPFGLFDWYVKPHLNSPSFPDRDGAWAERLAATVDFPLYLLDDDSAVRVRGDGDVDVVSEGEWQLIGPGS